MEVLYAIHEDSSDSYLYSLENKKAKLTSEPKHFLPLEKAKEVVAQLNDPDITDEDVYFEVVEITIKPVEE